MRPERLIAYCGPYGGVLRMAAETTAMSDTRRPNTGWTSPSPYPLSRVGDTYNTDRTIATMPHNDGLNAAFYDGHVKYQTIAYVNDVYQRRVKPFWNQ